MQRSQYNEHEDNYPENNYERISQLLGAKNPLIDIAMKNYPALGQELEAKMKAEKPSPVRSDASAAKKGGVSGGVEADQNIAI